MNGSRGRTDQTRGWILESFNKLMLARGYDRVGVTEVAARAGVGRSTFYEHFRGKGDVLRDAMRGMMESFADLVKPGDDARVRRTIEHMATHRPQAYRILSAAEDVISRQLTELIAARLPRRDFSLPRSMVCEQIARSQLGLLAAWLRPALSPCTPAAFASALRRSTQALVAC